MPLLADHLYTTKISSVGGLLTTVDSLPVLLKRQYINNNSSSSDSSTLVPYKPKSVAIKRSALETPLDLTVKSQTQCGFSSITPPSTPSPPKKRYKFALSASSPPPTLQQDNRKDEENYPPAANQNEVPKSNSESKRDEEGKKVLAIIKEELNAAKERQVTPKKPILSAEDSNLKTGKGMRPSKKQKRNKATRKLKFDEDTSSPVSGTIIRRLEEIEDEDQIGDIDPEYNIVEVTEEAKAEIAAIANVIGEYLCKLCRKLFDDAFELARHRCSCIVLLEYRCPECGKRFNCPANLASHRRWHKPRAQAKNGAGAKAITTATSDKYSCKDCKKTFKRLAYLKKHQLTHKSVEREASPESQENTHSDGSFYSMQAEDDKSVAMDTYQQQQQHHNPSKLQTFTQIVFRYASSMGQHSEDDENIVYSPLSRGSTPVSLCSMPPSPPQPPQQQQQSRMFGSLTEDENLAAAALTALGRNGPSVIRHTTLSV